MSTTQDTFTAVDETCPHGITGVEDDSLRCWFCHRSEGSDTIALNDPRREDE